MGFLNEIDECFYNDLDDEFNDNYLIVENSDYNFVNKIESLTKYYFSKNLKIKKNNENHPRLTKFKQTNFNEEQFNNIKDYFCCNEVKFEKIDLKFNKILNLYIRNDIIKNKRYRKKIKKILKKYKTKDYNDTLYILRCNIIKYKDIEKQKNILYNKISSTRKGKRNKRTNFKKRLKKYPNREKELYNKFF